MANFPPVDAINTQSDNVVAPFLGVNEDYNFPSQTIPMDNNFENISYSETISKIFGNTVEERLKSIPSCLFSICPDEVRRMQQLEKIDAMVNNAITRQQCVIQETWMQFDASNDHDQMPGTATSIAPPILQLHVYNTHFNQKTGNPELDSFCSSSVVDECPPRWILRIQGTLLNYNNGDKGRGHYPRYRMTSFFDRIMVSRKNETLIWDRSSQVPQKTVEKSCRDSFVSQVEKETNRIKSIYGIPPHVRTVSSLNSGSTHCDVQEKNLDAKDARDSSTHAGVEHSMRCFINATVSESATRHLVDCDGIELSRCGDEEEDIVITLFPSYKSPHFSFTPELASIVGAPIGTLSQAVHGVWLQSRAVTRIMNNDLTTCSCSETLQKLFNTERTTFNFYELPVLLQPHLKAVTPIVLTHRIKLVGDYVDNETTYQIYVDVSQIACPNVASNFIPSPCTTFGQISYSDDAFADCKDDERRLLRELQDVPPSEPPKESVLPYSTILETWDALQAAVIRRTLLLQFAENPYSTMKSLLTVHPDELQQKFLEQHELDDTRNDFYGQPWVASGIQAYLENHKKGFGDLANFAVQMSNPEKWNIDCSEVSGKTTERMFPSCALQPFSGGETTKSYDPNVRVPVFTQINRQPPFARYPSSDTPNPFNRYIHNFNPYVPSGYGMPMNHLGSFSMYPVSRVIPPGYNTLSYPMHNALNQSAAHDPSAKMPQANSKYYPSSLQMPNHVSNQ